MRKIVAKTIGAAPLIAQSLKRIDGIDVVKAAAKVCPSLKGKRVTVHVLRHTMAMDLLQAGVDLSVIALWLGHESVETTQIYLEATLAMKEKALGKTKPLNGKFKRYRPGDQLLGFLNNL